MEPLRFDGDVVVITGAGRGLGAEYARFLAERGASVVVNDVDVDAARALVGAIEKTGGTALFSDADVVSSASDLIDVAWRAFGRIDAIVNNAGLVRIGPFASLTEADLRETLDVHVVGTANVCRAAWPALEASHGRIVNTSSGSVFGMPGSTAYAAAKAAVLGFTRALALDAVDGGIRVNSIMPMAHTRMFELSGGVSGSAEDLLLRERFPASSVAPVVAALAHRSVVVSGECFEVAGGRVSRVAFAMGGTVESLSPEAVLDAMPTMLESQLTQVASLEEAMVAKLSGATTTSHGAEPDAS